MAQGMPPWSECENSFAVLFKIGKNNKPRYPENLSPKTVDFLNQCFQIDPKCRPNAQRLLQHPFITGEDLITPLQSDYYGVGLISDNFRNYFEKFVECGFSEKSRSELSECEPAQIPLFGQIKGQQQIEDGKTYEVPLCSLNDNFRIGKSYANGKLKHL